MYSLPGSIKMLLLQKDSTNIMHQADRQLDNGKVQTDRRQAGRQAGKGAARLSIHTSLMSIQTVGSLWLQLGAHSAHRR